MWKPGLGLDERISHPYFVCSVLPQDLKDPLSLVQPFPRDLELNGLLEINGLGSLVSPSESVTHPGLMSSSGLAMHP